MSQTIQIRQQNPDETENMAKLDSEDDVYGYLSRHLADQLGEFIAVELSDDDGTEVPADGVTDKGSGNYVTFETPGGNIVGFGIHLSILEDVLGFTVERDEDDNVTNAPESVNMAFSRSTEEDFEEAASADEDEVEALIAGGSASDEADEEGTDEEAEAEELVEIEDDELELEA